MQAKRITLDAIKDHLIPCVSRKTHTFEMWESLTKLYQSSNENRKMVLWEKLRSTKKTKTDIISTYLTKISQMKDELAVVGETIQPTQLVRIALGGFSKKWDVFVDGIVAHENLSGWETLWYDFMQEEIRQGSKNGGQQNGDDEENVALAGKGKKKSKKGSKGGNKQKGEGKKDMSKSSALLVTRWGTMLGNVLIKRINKLRLQQRWVSFPRSSRSFPQWFVFLLVQHPAMYGTLIAGPLII